MGARREARLSGEILNLFVSLLTNLAGIIKA